MGFPDSSDLTKSYGFQPGAGPTEGPPTGARPPPTTQKKPVEQQHHYKQIPASSKREPTATETGNRPPSVRVDESAGTLKGPPSNKLSGPLNFNAILVLQDEGLDEESSFLILDDVQQGVNPESETSNTTHAATVDSSQKAEVKDIPKRSLLTRLAQKVGHFINKISFGLAVKTRSASDSPLPNDVSESLKNLNASQNEGLAAFGRVMTPEGGVDPDHPFNKYVQKLTDALDQKHFLLLSVKDDLSQTEKTDKMTQEVRQEIIQLKNELHKLKNEVRIAEIKLAKAYDQAATLLGASKKQRQSLSAKGSEAIGHVKKKWVETRILEGGPQALRQEPEIAPHLAAKHKEYNELSAKVLLEGHLMTPERYGQIKTRLEELRRDLGVGAAAEQETPTGSPQIESAEESGYVNLTEVGTAMAAYVQSRHQEILKRLVWGDIPNAGSFTERDVHEKLNELLTMRNEATPEDEALLSDYVNSAKEVLKLNFEHAGTQVADDTAREEFNRLYRQTDRDHFDEMLQFLKARNWSTAVEQ